LVLVIYYSLLWMLGEIEGLEDLNYQSQNHPLNQYIEWTKENVGLK